MFSRHFNVGSITKGITDLFNLPSIIHPDVYNASEKQAADTFKFCNKVGLMVHITCLFTKDPQPVIEAYISANVQRC